MLYYKEIEDVGIQYTIENQKYTLMPQTIPYLHECWINFYLQKASKNEYK